MIILKVSNGLALFAISVRNAAIVYINNSHSILFQTRSFPIIYVKQL